MPKVCDPPEVKPLTIEEDMFVTQFIANGNDRIKAYQFVHPGCKYGTAATSAWRLLKKEHINAELRRRIRYEQGITKDFITHGLIYVLDTSKGTNPELYERTLMDCAKFAGFLVDKTQDVTETPIVTNRQVEDELVRRGLVAVPTN